VTASHLDWYTARAAGMLAYVLLTGGVLLGVLLAGRVRLPRWPAFAVTDVHRFVGLLVAVFVGLHVLAIALDTYVHFSLVQILVPGASSYRPLWVALGIVSAELLVAVAVSNLLRRRLGHHRWKRVHYLTFVVWAGAAVHGIGAGTDSNTAWLRLLYVVSIAGVLGAVVWRVGRVRLPVATAGAAAVVVFGFALVLGLGKLPAGLGSTKAAQAAVASPPGRVEDSFRGSVEQQQGQGGALVSVVGQAGGQRRLAVRLDLVTPDGEQITDTALQVRDLVSGQLCTGTVGRVGGSGFVGTCRFPGGGSRTVRGEWTVSGSAVSGRLTLARGA
jgi:sulfoxide reductase heme-binding subunit YedZ